jgi:hypothetical protein
MALYDALKRVMCSVYVFLHISYWTVYFLGRAIARLLVYSMKMGLVWEVYEKRG